MQRMNDRLTFEEHHEFGLAIKAMRRKLFERRIMNCGPKRSKEYKAVLRAQREIDILRAAMDDAAVRDYPDREGVTFLYYGA